MEGKISLIDGTFSDYNKDLMEHSDGMVNILDTDCYGIFKVGKQYKDIGTIFGIYNHPESSCAWLVIQAEGGQLVNIEIDFKDEIPF